MKTAIKDVPLTAFDTLLGLKALGSKGTPAFLLIQFTTKSSTTRATLSYFAMAGFRFYYPVAPAPDHSLALAQLSQLFPKIDVLWLKTIVSKYDSGSPDVVAKVSEKILVVYRGWYPQTEADPNSVAARNGYLLVLNERFPLADLAYLRGLIVQFKFNHGRFLRERVFSFDPVHKITDLLLEHDKRPEGYPKRTDVSSLMPHDFFRSDDYVQVHFSYVSHIRDVEHNF